MDATKTRKRYLVDGKVVLADGFLIEDCGAVIFQADCNLELVLREFKQINAYGETSLADELARRKTFYDRKAKDPNGFGEEYCQRYSNFMCNGPLLNRLPSAPTDAAS